MHMGMKYGIGLVTLLSSMSCLWAQAPAAVAPPAAAAAGPAAAAAPAGAQPGFLAKLCTQLAVCKEKLCGTVLGQLLNNSLRPVSALSGGLVPQCCPTTPNAAELAKPSSSAEGAAAQIKKDEAE